MIGSGDPAYLPGCTGKVGYETRMAAERQLRSVERRHKAGHRGRGKLHTYQCDFCRAWHLGTRSL